MVLVYSIPWRLNQRFFLIFACINALPENGDLDIFLEAAIRLET